MIAKQLTYTFILTRCRLTLIYCRYFSIMLNIRSVILKSNNNIVAKYIVLSDIISVVSDNILRRYLYSRTPLDIKKVYSSSSYFISI